MCAGGVLMPKFVCGPATKRSAARLPISFGELPEGHFVNSFFWARHEGDRIAIPTRSTNVRAACAVVLDTAFLLFIASDFYFRILEVSSRASTDFAGCGFFASVKTINTPSG